MSKTAKSAESGVPALSQNAKDFLDGSVTLSFLNALTAILESHERGIEVDSLELFSIFHVTRMALERDIEAMIR